MPVYHHLGKIPPKRHTQFAKPGGGFYYEQLFGTIGFDGMSSLLYHLHRPTQVRAILDTLDATPRIAVPHNMTARLLQGFQLAPADDYLDSRTPLMVNGDIHIGLAAPRKSLRDYFYKNADADELLFIHRGSGTLRTLLGNIRFEYGDYLVIPRGMIYQI
ncbi:MAG: homogentisate 1,2-dioxygenase, partial [Saprospiraceae bacterium]